MEDKAFVDSTLQFQGPYVLPVKLQAISSNKELLRDPEVYTFPAMVATAQVPGLCQLFSEKLENRSHFLNMHYWYSMGYNNLADFASDTFENEVRFQNMIGQDSLFVEGEENCSSYEHGVFFSLRPSALNSQLHFHKHHKHVNAWEPFQASFVTPRPKLILFDSCGEKERLLFHPNAVYKFVIPTAEEPHESSSHNKLRDFQANQFSFRNQAENSVDQVVGMTSTYRDSAVASAFALAGMRTNWVLSLNANNVDDQLQGFPHCDIEADSMSHVSYGKKSLRDNAEVSSSFHEDTLDIEALMSSDEDEDEMSTGHSPSNIMVKNKISGTCKRKASDNQCFEDLDPSCQEVESEFKENHYLSDLASSFVSGGIYQSIASLSTFDSGLDLKKSNDPSGLHAFLSLQDNNIDKKLCQDYSLLSGHYGLSTPRKRLRKDKIGRTMELLRSIIPGGNSMDAVDVLGEAIHYVRTLQLKVLKQELINREGSHDGTK